MLVLEEITCNCIDLQVKLFVQGLGGEIVCPKSRENGNPGNILQASNSSSGLCLTPCCSLKPSTVLNAFHLGES